MKPLKALYNNNLVYILKVGVGEYCTKVVIVDEYGNLDTVHQDCVTVDMCNLKNKISVK